MNKFAILALACSLGVTAEAAELIGAGASLPAPVYAAWSDAYLRASGNKINYQSIGSGGGKQQTISKNVDFGATDIPLSAGELDKNGLVQFPTVVGGAVPIVNLPGIEAGALRLSGPVLADIFLGKITQWNDSAITRLNPGVKIPSMSIAVIHRGDGAGTSFILTNYLSKVSPQWRTKVGEGTTVEWPVGLGGKGDEGVAGFVQRLPGSIGYVEYAYARTHKLSFTQMQHQNGDFLTPDDNTLQSAAVGANWATAAFGEVLTNQATKNAWPMTGATFVLLRKSPDKPEQAAHALKFFDWSYRNGGAMTKEKGYVALPDQTVAQIRDVWHQVRDSSSKPVFDTP